MNPTEPVKRLKFGFIFLCSNCGFKSQVHSKRDLNPRQYFLYDLRLSVDLMLNFFICSQLNFHISIAFRLWFVSLWQREYQLHRENKYLKIEFLLKSQAHIRVWLFFNFYDTFFRCGFNLSVDILNGDSIYTLIAVTLNTVVHTLKFTQTN